MRTVTCAPILGLCAASLFAQTLPNCDDTVNRTVVQRSVPTMTSGFKAKAGPECALCDLSSQPVKPAGANRTPIFRAIRALGSRIFPGNQPTRSNTVLLRRFWRGSDFRVVLGNGTESKPPCAAPVQR